MASQAQAGGPRFFLSELFGTDQTELNELLPELDDTGTTVSVPTAAVNEVQTVTITGSPTGGDFTLTYKGQTSAAIAFDADAATLEGLLEALSTIGTGNVSVSGSAGGPWTVTFQGTLAGRNLPVMTKDETGLTGGTSPDVTVAEQTAGQAQWNELPDTTDESKVTFLEENEDVWPLHLLFRQEDVVIRRGIDMISLTYARRDLANWRRMLEQGKFSQVAAGADQVAKDKYLYGAAPTSNQYRHLLALIRNHLGFSTVWIFPKIRVRGAFDLTWGHQVTKIANEFKVFAHPGLADDENLVQVHEITAAATS